MERMTEVFLSQIEQLNALELYDIEKGSDIP